MLYRDVLSIKRKTTTLFTARGREGGQAKRRPGESNSKATNRLAPCPLSAQQREGLKKKRKINAPLYRSR